jgi:hypothetical protein
MQPPMLGEQFAGLTVEDFGLLEKSMRHDLHASLGASERQQCQKGKAENHNTDSNKRVVQRRRSGLSLAAATRDYSAGRLSGAVRLRRRRELISY